MQVDICGEDVALGDKSTSMSNSRARHTTALRFTAARVRNGERAYEEGRRGERATEKQAAPHVVESKLLAAG